jgi:general secretion pathway protein G
MHVLAQIRKARQSESGFTLIELLIVIVILGVLAGIVVFAVGGITDTGDTAACKADIKTVTTAVEAFRAQSGAYPATGDVGAEAALVPKFLNSYPDTVTYTLAAGDPDVAGAAGAVNDCTGITI